MVLVLAEKKEVAYALSAAFPDAAHARASSNRIEQGQFLITWLGGHIMQLKEPEDYDYERYKPWSIEQLPINFENWGNCPSKKSEYKRKQLQQIGHWISQCDSIIHAGDPDQEGQLLVDEVLREFNWTGKTLRINTSDTTEEGLKQAFANMTDNNQHISGGWSAYARSVADFMVGINMSRLFTKMNGVLLSVGRVQTPTLGLVVNRDRQIEGHAKLKYYTISATIILGGGQEIKVSYTPAKDAPDLVDGRIIDVAVAKEKIRMLQQLELTNIKIDKKIEFEKPPMPFNLVKLQSYCSKHFNMNLEQSMEASQSLRDKHHAITYNRSSCQYLTDNHYALAPATMEQVIENIRFRPKGMDMTIKAECFNNEKVGEHHGIIPQNKKVNLADMSQDEKNVYLAIVKYFMAQFMPPAKKEVTRLSADLPDGGTLKATSTVILDPGYRAIFKEAEPVEESVLSSMPKGNSYSGTVTGPTSAEKETKPPARYTQASLAEDMTVISKYCTDERIKRLLREKDKDSKEDNGSIGTVATRTTIIKELITKGFLHDDGKHVISTPLGRELYDLLPDEIRGVNLTAEWWLVCERIVEGTATPKDLQDDVLKTINYILEHRDEYPRISAETVAKNMKVYGKVPVGLCPACNAPVIEGEKGFGCSAWKQGCKFVIWKEQKAPFLKDVKITKQRVEKLLRGEAVDVKGLYSQRKANEGEDPTFNGKICLKEDPQWGWQIKLADKGMKGRGGPKERGGPSDRGSKTHQAKTRGAKSHGRKPKVQKPSQTTETAEDEEEYSREEQVS